jgi:hypothetical protein
MTNKSVYQNLDQTVLQHFGLESAPVYGVLSSNLDNAESVICIQDPDIYNNIENILKKETLSTSWKNYKRAFVLPKCPVSLDRIKAAAKEHNIVIVGDYKKADFIISHNDINETVNNSDTIKSTLLLAKLWNYNLIDDTLGRLPIVDSSGMSFIYDDKWTKSINIWNYNTKTLYDSWMITGMAIDIAYLLETGSLGGTVNIDTFIHSSATIQDLTEELVETIANMLSSYSDDDIEIVSKLLPTINLNENHHLLWLLFNKIDRKLSHFNRNKDVQFWLSRKKYNYANLDAQELILRLEKDNLLDKTTFKFLEPICRKQIQIYNRDLYVFNVSVKPKYQEYLK